MSLTSPTLTVAPEPLAKLEGAWAELAARLPRPLPFDHPVWHRAWWSHFGEGRTPVYLAVREGGALAGVVPLMQDSDILALAGDPEICDYTDVAVPETALPGVFAAIDALPWRTLHLWGLPEESPALAAALRWGEERGYDTETDFEAVCPRISLPQGAGGHENAWDAYLASLSKKDRHELKRKLRRFGEAGNTTRLRALRAGTEVAEALDTFFLLHRISHRGKAEFMTPRMEAFFREMAVGLADAGLARLYLVEVDGRPVAAQLAFVSGDELLLYNSGYDPAYAHASIGIATKALTLQAAIAEGMRTYDFLRGAEPYKYDLGATDRIVRQVWIRRDA